MVMVSRDGSRVKAVRRDYLDWLEEAPALTVDADLGCEIQVATTERPKGPIAVMVAPITPEPGDPKPEIVAVVMPVRHDDDLDEDDSAQQPGCEVCGNCHDHVCGSEGCTCAALNQP